MDYQNIANLSNIYALRIYIICKIAQNKFNSHSSIENTLDDFKKRIGLGGKYADIPKFKSRVLDVTTKEINEKTDLNFSYALSKTGKKFTHITLGFSQKKDITVKHEKSPKGVKAPQTPSSSTEGDTGDIIARSKMMGLSIKSTRELIKGCGFDLVEKGLGIVEAEINAGKKINSPSGYLITTVENLGLSVSTDDIQKQLAANKKAKDKQAENNENNWQAIEKYCTDNQAVIEGLLNLKRGSKLFLKSDIEVFESLEIMIEQHPELININRIIRGFIVNNKGADFNALINAVARLSIANDAEKLKLMSEYIDGLQDAKK